MAKYSPWQRAKDEEDAFRAIMPKTGFIAKYLHYTDRSDSPGSFHFWVCASVLCSIVMRRAYIGKGIYNVYPALYIVLVAPSGVCRKSRAVRLGMELIEDFPWMNVIADKTSPEALLNALMVGTTAMEADEQQQRVNFNLDHTGLIRAGELDVFLNRTTYTSGMVGLLTHLYDCPPTFKFVLRTKRAVILNNPMLTLVGASTPKWLATCLPEGAFEGGFMSRFIFVFKQVRDRIGAWPGEVEPGLKEELRRDLLKIRAGFTGKIGLESDARSWFDQWYDTQTKLQLDDVQLSGFVERKPDTMLKLGMMLAASEMRDIVSKHDLMRSLRIIEWTQERMFKAFEHVELSPLGQLRQRVLDILTQAGSLTRREITRRLAGKLPEGIRTLEKLQGLMVEAEEIAVQQVSAKGKGGRPSIIWTRLGGKGGDQKAKTDGAD